MEEIKIYFFQDKTQVCIYCLDNEEKETNPEQYDND